MTRIDPVGFPGARASAWIEAGFVRLLEARPAEEIDRTFPDLEPARLAALLADRSFGEQVEALGGYDASQMGQVMAEIG